jgi:hypothetical protein
LSEIRAVANRLSKIFASVVVARWMGELDDERLRLVLDGDPRPMSNLWTSTRWRARRWAGVRSLEPVRPA